MARTKGDPRRLVPARTPARELRRLVREVCLASRPGYRFQDSAFRILAAAAERHVAGVLEEAEFAAAVAGRGAATPRDVRLARRLHAVVQPRTP